MKILHHYFYDNTPLIEECIDRLEIDIPSIAQFTPEFKRKFVQCMSLPKKIETLEKHLAEASLLATSRPTVFDEAYSKRTSSFVKETAIAQKLLIPIDGRYNLPGMPYIAVWISDPDPSQYSPAPFEWIGSFLILIQTIWEDGSSGYISGVSALQVVANLCEERGFYDKYASGGEPMGRSLDLHPVDKLKMLRAIQVGAEEIETLYRVRYMSNEQRYTHDGESRRVNDILGYPLYIRKSTQVSFL